MTVLAGDIGGTNSRLRCTSARPGSAGTPLFERTYPSGSHHSLDDIADIFLGRRRDAGGARGQGQGHRLRPASPSPDRSRTTSAGPPTCPGSWTAAHWPTRLGIERVRLVNDFHAAALGVTAVDPDWLAPLGGVPAGAPRPHRRAGCGHRPGRRLSALVARASNVYQVVASEGGHMDFAPRTPLEVGLLQYLANKYGRVSCERVLSGRGLVDVFGFLSQEPGCRALIRPETSAALAAPSPRTIPRRSSPNGDCPAPIRSARCRWRCSARCWGRWPGTWRWPSCPPAACSWPVASPRACWPYLQKGLFREAFDRKGRLHTMVERIPAFVVTHPHVGLVGAAAAAATL